MAQVRRTQVPIVRINDEITFSRLKRQNSALTKCRVCLKMGNIPIFGDKCRRDISGDVKALGGIEVSIIDCYPHCLCQACFQLLQAAKTFRETAQATDKLLRTRKTENDNHDPNIPIKEELVEVIIEGGETLCKTKEPPDANGSFDIESKKRMTPKARIDLKIADDIIYEPIEALDYDLLAATVNDDDMSIKQEPIVMSTQKNNIVVNIKQKPEQTDKKNKRERLKLSQKGQILKCKGKEVITLDYLKSLDKQTQSIQAHQRIRMKQLIQEKLKRQIKNNDSSKKVVKKISVNIDNTTKTEEKPKRVRKRTNNVRLRKMICDICGKVSNHVSAFLSHYATHSDNLPSKCDQCPYRGRNAALLAVHKRSHAAPRYLCPHCPIRRTTASNLRRHMRVHMGPGQFACNLCEKRYYSKLELDRHVSGTHMGLRPFVCKICQGSFTTKAQLSKHNSKVHQKNKKKLGRGGRLPLYLIFEQKAKEKDAENENT